VKWRKPKPRIEPTSASAHVGDHPLSTQRAVSSAWMAEQALLGAPVVSIESGRAARLR